MSRPLSSKSQVLSVILAVISITLSIFFFLEKKKNETLGTLMADQAKEILQANVLIGEHNRRVDELYMENAADKKLLEQAISRGDHFYKLHIKAEGVVEQLKIQLNEKPVILNVDDSEQLRIFLEWSQLK